MSNAFAKGLVNACSRLLTFPQGTDFFLNTYMISSVLSLPNALFKN
jgi:hypothetical protein